MRELPDDGRLATLACRGDDLVGWLKRIAEVLATFHRHADRSPEIDAAGSQESLREAWEVNFSEVSPFVGTLLDEEVESEIQALALRWLEGRTRLLDSRIASKSVCDGHGDLQAEDVFCLEEGIQILDCIEFSDRLRHCDVASDVAFLAMDLQRLGRADDSERLLVEYEDASRNLLPRHLVYQYAASHAYVRAKVACLRLSQGAEASRSEAIELHHLALAYLRRARVRMVVIGGPPGSGKSTIAEGLSKARGWTLLRSDQVRVELGLTRRQFGLASQTDPYDISVRSIVYEELLDRAARLLELGESVVLDASWIESDRRDAARALAEKTSSDIYEMRCEVSEAEGALRVDRRLSAHSDPSEASPEVAAAMRGSMDAWGQATVVDTSGRTAEQGIALALAALSD
jgi:predicted kinase